MLDVRRGVLLIVELAAESSGYRPVVEFKCVTEALEIAAFLRQMIAAEVVQVLDDKAKPGGG